MKNKQSLKLHQAQHQRQAFSPARGRFVETLTKSRQELNVQLRSLIAANPFLHTVSDEVLSIQPAAASDIREDLLLQLHTGSWPCRTEAAEYIIESLDDHGFFDPQLPAPGFSASQIDDALRVVQQFEPFGVGLRSSVEYLVRQLESRQEALALRILTEGAQELTAHQTAALCQKLKITEDQLTHQLKIIRSCQLYPCQLNPASESYIQADILLELEDDEFRITSLTPQVVVDRPQGPLSPELKRYLNEAQLTLDLIDQRNLTLQLVFRCLVRYQQNHLMKGAPLAICRLKDIAEDTGLHISTVSRACAHKYFEYQGHIRPVSDLLCKSIHHVSYSEIELHLRTWIAAENSADPLDDDQLARRFASLGVPLSRRRIAAYRKRLNIPNSYQRRQISKTQFCSAKTFSRQSNKIEVKVEKTGKAP